MEPDFTDMKAFDKWWATKGWWLGRQLNLDEATIKRIWEEGYNQGASSPRHRDRWTERYEDLGDMRGEY